MTHSEAKKELNDMLASLQALLSQTHEDKERMQVQGDYWKKQVRSLLTKMGSQKEKAAGLVSFYCDANRMNFRDDDRSYCQKINTCFREGINALIKIVQAELNIQKQVVDEDNQQKTLAEQQKSNAIQYGALVCSIVATIISLIALFVAICK